VIPNLAVARARLPEHEAYDAKVMQRQLMVLMNHDQIVPPMTDPTRGRLGERNRRVARSHLHAVGNGLRAPATRSPLLSRLVEA
jgi:hypothetical protein